MVFIDLCLSLQNDEIKKSERERGYQKEERVSERVRMSALLAGGGRNAHYITHTLEFRLERNALRLRP